MNELSFSLLCFNTAKKCNNKNIASYLCNGKPDLCFLQEITADEVKKWRHEYECVYLQEQGGTSSPCNCLLYKKSKFSVLSIDDKKYALDEGSYTEAHKPDILKTFEEKLKYEKNDDPLKKRACVAILECIGNDCSSTWHPRVIVVSFHNPKKILVVRR